MSIALAIPNTHPCYEDHFPGNPIVPGALLLHWITVAIDNSGMATTFARVQNCKFLAVVKPGDSCQLQLKITANKNTVAFTCMRQDVLVASGKCQFDAGDTVDIA